MKELIQLPGKKWLFFALLFAGGLLVAKTLQSNSQSVVKLSDADSGKVLNMIKGRVFTLSLPDHVDGGYRFDTIQYNPRIIMLQKHTATPPSPNSPPGRSGTDTWQFMANAPGQSVLKVTASRPWKGGGTVAVFENKIMVK